MSKYDEVFNLQSSITNMEMDELDKKPDPLPLFLLWLALNAAMEGKGRIKSYFPTENSISFELTAPDLTVWSIQAERAFKSETLLHTKGFEPKTWLRNSTSKIIEALENGALSE